MAQQKTGVIWLKEPIWGRWPFRGFPDEVCVEGRLFRKARWKQPYDGVVEQYREAVQRKSMHLMVYADGSWAIRHSDGDNPDMGRPVEHLLNDHPVGAAVKGFVAIAGVLVLVAGVSSVLSGR
jgi:hypothetical protein